MTQVNINHAAILDGEDRFLSAVVDDLCDENAKLVYADWLEEQRDNRAEFLRQYAMALQSMDLRDFPEPGDVPIEWRRMIGADFVQRLLADTDSLDEKPDLSKFVDDVLKLAKPAIAYEKGRQLDDMHIPIGATKLYGLPDLPAGSVWPTQKDCKALFAGRESVIAPDTPCTFLCQINLADLVGTLASRQCPGSGLISIFACMLDDSDFVEGHIVYIRDTDNLVRMAANEPTDEEVFYQLGNGFGAAMPMRWGNATQMIFSEDLQFPSPYGKSWSDRAAEIVDYDFSETYAKLCGELESFLGYTQTEGGDPGQEGCKLLCIKAGCLKLHFSIRNEDLAAGRFDDVRLAGLDGVYD